MRNWKEHQSLCAIIFSCSCHSKPLLRRPDLAENLKVRRCLLHLARIRAKHLPPGGNLRLRLRCPPIAVSVSWWNALSPERKLDVVGAGMSVAGLLILLILFSAQRSEVTASLLRLLGQMVGWGIYVLPVALILMGLWLILRRIEKLPPLSLERATGIILFFLWLLAVMQSIALISLLKEPEQVVRDGQGGGYIGDLFARILFNGFGAGGAVVALLAWLLITLIMIFDISVEDLFRWVNPLGLKVRAWLAKPIKKTEQPFLPAKPEVSSNGYTPLDRPQPVVENETPGVPVRTVKSAETVINWQLPEAKQILDSGSGARGE